MKKPDFENSPGAYTSRRRVQLAEEWYARHETMVGQAKAKGWFLPLQRAVEDGANIAAQCHWAQKNNPGWSPPRHHQHNIALDPVRGWFIDVNRNDLARWEARGRP